MGKQSYKPKKSISFGVKLPADAYAYAMASSHENNVSFIGVGGYNGPDDSPPPITITGGLLGLLYNPFRRKYLVLANIKHAAPSARRGPPPAGAR